MKIAVVTGASSGIGREFVHQIARTPSDLDEIWCISRNRTALQELKNEIPRVRVIPIDITRKEGLLELEVLLREQNPFIWIFVHAAGSGIQKKVEKTSLWELSDMTELNCTALIRITKLLLPFCEINSRILYLSSSAAFLPQPGFAVYAATKAYVLSFSRALHRELKGMLTVTAVCPGPVDTPFLGKMGGRENMPAYKKRFIASAGAVVKKALKDSARGKEISIYGFSMKALHVLCKVLPHSLLMRFTGK